jgi:hypothetical protein
MNPRIRELIKTKSTILFPGTDTVDCEITDIEKFAQLIVEECCNRLSEETIRHDGYGYNQHELYNRLRKHFGIES